MYRLVDRLRFSNNYCMRVASSEVFEAEQLLEEISSWSEEEIEELPRLYREKAKEYRSLLQQGD